MRRTVYSFLSTIELLDYAQNRDGRTEMEVELAQRLEVSIMTLPPEEAGDIWPIDG